MLKVPGYARTTRRTQYQRPPELKTRAERKPTQNVTRAAVTVPQETFDVGEGPWTVQGKPASKPEYKVAVILSKLGRRYLFQQSAFGGRLIRGGQVIDFLLEDFPPRTVVDVRSYHHMGARGEAQDAQRRLQVLASDPHSKYVVVWEEDTLTEEFLYRKLSIEVGTSGK